MSVARRFFMGCIGCSLCQAACPYGAIELTGRQTESVGVLPLAELGEPADADSFDRLLVARRSIRRYQARPVEREKLDRVLEMAATAPMGIPPSDVGVVVMAERAKVAEFTADAVAGFRQMLPWLNRYMLLLMRPMIGKAAYESMREFVVPLLREIIAEHDKGGDAFAYGAPAALLFHHGPMADPADASIAATYAMLAAETLGLGSCMLGTPVALSHNPGFKRKYRIPKANKIGLALVLGYPGVHFVNGLRRQFASVDFA